MGRDFFGVWVEVSGGDVIVGGVGGLLGVSGVSRVTPYELRHAAVSFVV